MNAIKGEFKKYGSLSEPKSIEDATGDPVVDTAEGHADNADQLQRRLGNRQIQLIAIGGSIGTALFVSIGGALAKGGPGSLFIAYTLYSCVLLWLIILWPK